MISPRQIDETIDAVDTNAILAMKYMLLPLCCRCRLCGYCGSMVKVKAVLLAAAAAETLMTMTDDQ